ncbi:MAG: hypothetical protein AB7F99_11045 [Vicinamibacterales bacterium]
MPVTLVSFVACRLGRLSAWRPEDHSAYKVVRLLGSRRIRGSGWLPRPGCTPQRLSNAHRHLAFGWFVEKASPHLEVFRERGRGIALVPFPDPERIVGAPPSPSRRLAQALADSCGLRVLDVLRWRQPMQRCRKLDVQTLADNLLTTGNVLQVGCILVADCVSGGAGVQAASSHLRRHGGTVSLAISAGRAGPDPEAEPFSPVVAMLEDVTTIDL